MSYAQTVNEIFEALVEKKGKPDLIKESDDLLWILEGHCRAGITKITVVRFKSLRERIQTLSQACGIKEPVPLQTGKVIDRIFHCQEILFETPEDEREFGTKPDDEHNGGRVSASMSAHGEF